MAKSSFKLVKSASANTVDCISYSQLYYLIKQFACTINIGFFYIALQCFYFCFVDNKKKWRATRDAQRCIGRLRERTRASMCNKMKPEERASIDDRLFVGVDLLNRSNQAIGWRNH